MGFFRRVVPRLTAALLVSTLSGCAWLPQSDVAGSVRMSGLLHLTAERAQLETCAGPIYTLQSDEALRSLFEQVAQPGQTAIFVELKGQLLADESIRPETVLRMGSSGNGCADPVDAGSQWVAVGEQPDWQARIAPQGMQLTALEADWRPVIVEQLPGGARGFRSLEGESAELWIYPQPCFARLSGDYYQNTARLLTAGESFAGCAYPGVLAGDQASPN